MRSFDIRSPKFALRSSYVFFTVSIVMVLYNYRLGGTRDFGLYVNAGRAFINGENAYETQLWRSGSFGSTVMWLTSLPIPSSLEPHIFQLPSFAGFFIFANLLGIASEKRFWIYGIILFLSPVGEVRNTIQITGFLIGLLAISLIAQGPKSKLTPFTYTFLQGTAMAIALDLKPHSIMFVIVLLFVKKMKREVVFWAFGICFIGHAVINVINKNILEVSWVHNLMNLGNASGENGESTSIWRLVDHLSEGKANTSVISLLLIVFLLLIVGFFGEKFSLRDLVLIGLILSSFMTYMHYYDLAPLSVCILVLLSKNSKSILGLSTLMFMILPREVGTVRNVLILLLLTSLISLFIQMKNDRVRDSLIAIGLAMSTFIGLHLVNYLLALEYHLGHALVTTQTMILILSFIISKSKLTQGLEWTARNRFGKEKGL